MQKARTACDAARQTLLAVLGAALLVTAIPVAPAVAAGPTLTATVFLRSPDEAALLRLAATPAGSRRADRVAAVRRLEPTPAAHARVEDDLRRRGLHVVDGTSWTVTVAGPASAVASAFGTRAAAAPAYPQVPASLRSAVSVALPASDGPAPFRHHDAVPLDGTDFRNAYTSPGVTPPSGDSGTAATVATLQLSSWNSDDLTQYAARYHLPDPVASKRYREVQVDGGSTDSSGDLEVDLDQEAILSTAPTMRQQAYFAPNSAAGFGDVFAHVYDDVTGSSGATAPNPNIVALSSSWGGCESSMGASAIRAYEPLIAAVVAAGVTVFSASGDTGIYDCGDVTGTGLANTQADVDYPASSPHVIGVGGTNLQRSGSSAPNDGSNWQETTWTCSDSVSCQSTTPPIIDGGPGGTGGSGGGVSGNADDGSSDSFAGFAAPTYQSVTVRDVPFNAPTRRMVPDITADADPQTGFVAYTSDSQYVVQSGSNDVQVGGTSLAAPVSAALLADMLVSSGRATGVGDVHPALYSAYASGRPGVVRDITSGSNGSSSDKGADPSVAAQAGYDTTSGVGGVLWPALMPWLSSTAKPAVSATLSLPRLHRATSTTAVRATWKGRTMTATSLAVGTVSVTITRAGASTPVYRATAGPTGSYTFAGAPGATYTVVARATDLGGHVSATVRRTVSVPVDDKRFAFHGSWRRVTSAADIGGSRGVSTSRGAYATVTAKGRGFALRVVRCPGCGILTVFRVGRLIRTINLYAATRSHAVVMLLSSSTRAKRTFTFRCTGRKVARSSGRVVDLDALLVAW